MRSPTRRLIVDSPIALHGTGDDDLDVGALERDEHRHQLRDARDRHARVRMPAREHLAGRTVLHVVRLRHDRGGTRRSPKRRRRARRRRRRARVPSVAQATGRACAGRPGAPGVQAGFSSEQLLDGRVVVERDLVERAAGLHLDEDRLRLRRRRRRRCRRAGRRGHARRAAVVVSPSFRPARTSSTAIVMPARNAAGAASLVKLPVHQPETAQTSARSRAASAPADARQSPLPDRYA